MRVKLSKYAKMNGISYMSAYRYFNNGLIKGIKLKTGTILIDIEEEGNENITKNTRVVLYTRVSSSENKTNLDTQLDRLRSFAVAKGYTITKEIKEIGSGLNDKRPKLAEILKDDNWDVIIVEHKDRLARFGLNYLELLLNKQNKKIEVINECLNEKEDLMTDFVSIITSFCSRLYGLRRNKRRTEQIIKELTTND
jgi:predicted site-specific integrase-resolvase